jgi:hypothetical protein
MKSKILDLVRTNAQPYTVRRETEASDDETLGAPASADYEEIGTRELALHSPTERTAPRPEGDVLRGTLEGVAEAGTDIEPGDRIEYGSRTYELVRALNQPPSDPSALMLEFERV